MSIFNQDSADCVSSLRQNNDTMDTFLALASPFDFITLFLNWLQGYNTLYAGGLDYETAVLTQMSLAGQGIRARVEGVGSYRVVVKE